MTPQQAKKWFDEHQTRYVLAQFVDIHGAAKAKAVPVEHYDMVLGDGAGFALKAGAQLGAGCALLAENLDGDIAVEARVAGAIHLAHAAYSECGLDLIDAKAGIGS